MSIKPGTFSEACYNQNSIDELRTALLNGRDETDMQVWGLSEDEWEEQVVAALYALGSKHYEDLIFEGVKYVPIQDAYPSDNGSQWEALAIDDKGNQYMVYWDVITDDNEGDFSNDCNWENAAEVVLI
ncbi:hypothetical protein QUO15_004413 [Vibrio parahaemolyticus]|nr:hypothetical protein [Vibrio parahaemolyticus]